jgi:hypothetical protein
MNLEHAFYGVLPLHRTGYDSPVSAVSSRRPDGQASIRGRGKGLPAVLNVYDKV